MNIKEHLQFFVLMIPTLLLLIAAVMTLAAPGAPRAAAAGSADPQGRFEVVVVVVDAEAGPLNAVSVR